MSVSLLKVLLSSFKLLFIYQLFCVYVLAPVYSIVLQILIVLLCQNDFGIKKNHFHVSKFILVIIYVPYIITKIARAYLEDLDININDF